MKFNLQIIRHGKTEAVQKAIYCGFSDLPLNEEGILEIKGFIDLKMYRPAEVYYSSGLKRAVKTLQLIAENAPWDEIADLKECNFGDFELQKHDDLLSKVEYNDWINDHSGTYQMPNGESVEMFNQRVISGFDQLFQNICSREASTALVTTHGGVIAYFITKYVDPSLNMYDAMPSHGRGYDVDIDYSDSNIKILSIKKI